MVRKRVISNKVRNVMLGNNIFKCKNKPYILLTNIGFGEVLLYLLERYIWVYRKAGMTDKAIADYLSNNLYAFEYDTVLYENLLNVSIPKLLKQLKFKELCCFKHIYNRCFLDKAEQLKGKFDLVIGTPILPNMCSSVEHTKYIENSGYFEIALLYSKLAIDCLNDSVGNNCIMLLPHKVLRAKSSGEFIAAIKSENLLSMVYDFGYESLNNKEYYFVCIMQFEKKRSNTMYGYATLCKICGSNHFDIQWFDNKKDNLMLGVNAVDVFKNEVDYLIENCIFYPKVLLSNRSGIMRQTGRLNGNSEFVLFNGFLVERAATITVGNVSTLFDGVMQYDTYLFLYKYDVYKACYVPLTETEAMVVYPRAYKYIKYYSSLYSYSDLVGSSCIERNLINDTNGYVRLVCNFAYKANYDTFSVVVLPNTVTVRNGVILGVRVEDSQKIIALLQSKSLYKKLKTDKAVLKVEDLLAYKLN